MIQEAVTNIHVKISNWTGKSVGDAGDVATDVAEMAKSRN